MNTLFCQSEPREPVSFGVKTSDSSTVRFTVYGKPVPQGSAKAFYVKSLGRAVITSDNKNLKPWRQQLSDTAMSLRVPCLPREKAVEVGLVFYFERPKSTPKSRIYPTVKPDLDKLIRSILDSCTGIIFTDDSQVVRFTRIEKHYGLPERVEIQIGEV